MSLKSKSFLLYKGDTTEHVSSFLREEIGLDAFLVKGIQVVALNDNVTQVTVLYNKYPDIILDSIAPREGSVFSTGSRSNDFDIRLLFNYPIDFRSITSGAISIDDQLLDTGSFYLDPNSNNYYIKVSATGSSFQTDAFHTYQVSSSVKRLDGSPLPYSPVGGYVFNSLSSAYIGDYTEDYLSKRRGIVSLSVIRLSKNRSAQQGISEFFSQRAIPTDSLLYYTSTSTSINTLDVYILYISKLEPQIIGGFPLNNSLLPDVSAPDKVTLVYNTPLDKAALLANSGLFSIEEGFSTSTNVTSDKLNLLDDLKTIEIDTSSYFTAQKVYSIVSRPGLLGINGQSKLKPEQWTIHISAYAAGGGFTGDISISGSFTGAPTDAYYVLLSGNPSLSNAVVLSYKNRLTGVFNGSSLTLSGIGIEEHFANVSNPHSTTAAQVGAPTTANHSYLSGVVSGVNTTLTGHVGTASIHYTQSEILIPTSQIISFGTTVSGLTQPHTGDTSIHYSQAAISITSSQISNIGSTVSGLIKDHTGDASLHYTQAAIAIPSSQISDFGSSLSGLTFPHTSDSTIHFTQAAISIPSSQISNFGSSLSGLISPHTGDLTIHYPQSQISITSSQISNFGSTLSGLINPHTGDSTIHFTQSQISIPSSQISNFGSAVSGIVSGMITGLTGITGGGGGGGISQATFSGHTGDLSIHYNMASISISTSQVYDFEPNLESVVGPFITGLSGTYVKYEDGDANVRVGLDSVLYTGITGHLSRTGVHYTQPEMYQYLANNQLFQDYNNKLTQIALIDTWTGNMLVMGTGTMPFQALSGGTSGQVLTMYGRMPAWRDAATSSGSGSDPWTYVTLGTTFTTTSSSAIPVTGLFFTITGNRSYEFEARLMVRTVFASIAPRLGVKFPFSGLTDGVARIEVTSSASAQVMTLGTTGAALLSPVGALPAANISYPAFIKGMMVAGATATGQLYIQLAAEAAGTGVSVRAGSFLKYRTLPT